MSIISSTPSSSAAATVVVSSWWLKDPTDPTRNINVYPELPVKTAKEEVQSVLKPIGRTREVIIADKVLGEHLDLDVWFTTAAGAAAFETLRNSQRILLLQSSGTEQWYGKFAGQRKRTILATPDLSWRQASATFIETDAV